MMAGKKTNLSSLVSSVGDQSPVGKVIHPTSAKLAELAANPHNQRDVGDVSDLASIADTQLQPALVVTKAAYLRLYPGEDFLAGVRYIVINGNRRLAAAAEYNLATVDIVVKDEIARDRATILAAGIKENVARRDYDVIEEARAVQQLTEECGSADAAAAQLGKTKAWVSQRRSLLKLAPEMQAHLRAGDLAIRDARSLALVPQDKQVAAWLTKTKPEPKKKPEPKHSQASAQLARAFRRYKAGPGELAEVLRDYLDTDQLAQLRSFLDETP